MELQKIFQAVRASSAGVYNNTYMRRDLTDCSRLAPISTYAQIYYATGAAEGVLTHLVVHTAKAKALIHVHWPHVCSKLIIQLMVKCRSKQLSMIMFTRTRGASSARELSFFVELINSRLLNFTLRRVHAPLLAGVCSTRL